MLKEMNKVTSFLYFSTCMLFIAFVYVGVAMQDIRKKMFGRFK